MTTERPNASERYQQADRQAVTGAVAGPAELRHLKIIEIVTGCPPRSPEKQPANQMTDDPENQQECGE